jgi:hypothetical protein
MVTARRIKRLRDLIAEIELLPVSPDRDRLLSEFRSRAVDVDIGATPRAMLPLREPAPAPVLDHKPPQRDRAPSMTRMAPPPPALVVEFARPASAASGSKNLEPFWEDARLSLEDSPRLSPALVRTRGGRAVPPWTLGLRG